MLTDPVSISSLSLVFVLGLRHGFDPDHIAIIDCMAYRSIQDRPAFASWIGTLFALGHGLTVTAIAVVLCAFTREVSLPESLSLMLSWVPVGLLILIGTLNLRDLLRADHYQPKGWKTHFIPKRLRDSSHPLAIFFIGVMFALVFDTATQAAAWGYAATTQGGVAMALMLGLAFTLGMLITDTMDGRLMVRLLQRLRHRNEALEYRRKIGWLIVLLSYGIALYSILKHFKPALEISETLTTIAGASLFVCLVLAYCWAMYRHPPALRHKER
jgi:nickel/cobalt transporter (NiCoT) family protein